MSTRSPRSRAATKAKPRSAAKPGAQPRKRPASSRKRKTPAPRRSVFGWVFKRTLLFGFLAFIGWCIWIDFQVRASFSALQWALPARIYARPVELYTGAHLSAAELIDNLQRLGYRESVSLDNPGEYQRQSQVIRLRTRGFDFWDGDEQSLYVEVGFDERRVRSLRAGPNSTPVPLVRLEPVEIAQINPDTGEDRLPLSLSEVPPALIQAVIAVEDQRFYNHFGVDPMGIARALVANLRSGGIVQGGSTLTQQLVKNLYLHRDQTLRRKAEEALMAIALELHFSKDQILEAYMNEVFLGQEGNRAIHGFALGAEYYFGRPLSQLSLDELALLAGLPRGPSLYNPRRNPERATARRNTVLARMVDAGYISDSQREQASNAGLRLSGRPANRGSGYPSFLELVREDLARDYDADALRTEGLRIFTTLDVRVQSALESVLDSSVSAVEVADNGAALQAAVVLTDTATGEVRALAGSRSAGYTGFNRALHARRPIGSLVKPAVYLAALESGNYNLASVLSDTEQEISLPNGQTWSPRNYDERSRGDVYLYDALERSLNQATVDLGMGLGLERTTDMLRRLGHTRQVQAFPSVLLGSVEMSPVEVAQMYQTLASNGFRSPLRAVEAVMTGRGERLQRYGIATEQIADPTNMYLLEYMMQGVFYRGTARSVSARLDNHLPLAGKTGSTNDLRDSWFAGYGDDLVGVVWLGHDDNRATGLSGATGALRVWSDIMLALDVQPRLSPAPASVEWRRVALEPARSPNARDCRQDRSLPFRSDALPDIAVDCESNGSLFERVIDRVRSIRP